MTLFEELEFSVLTISDVLASILTLNELLSLSSILSQRDFLNHCLTLQLVHDLDQLVSIFLNLPNLYGDQNMFLGPIFGHGHSLALFSSLAEFPKIETFDAPNNTISDPFQTHG